MLEVMLQHDQIHKYPENSIWEVDDGRLIIYDVDSEPLGCYSVGQWTCVRKVKVSG